MDPIYLTGFSLAPRPKLSQLVDNIPAPSHFVNTEQLSVEAETFTHRTLFNSPIAMSSIPDPSAENNAAVENIGGISKRPLSHENQVAPVGTLSVRKKRYSNARQG